MIDSSGKAIKRTTRRYWPPDFGSCCIQPGRQFVKPRVRSHPLQLIHILEQPEVGSEGGQSSKKNRPIPLAAKSIGEGASVRGVHAPFTAVLGNGFEMQKLRQHSGRGLRAPAR